ncbi:MAG TPA: heparan N-sulfatase [Spirochaetia bacterium]|nr:heparan N-sulfatase [Spirochaetia bacterium]
MRGKNMTIKKNRPNVVLMVADDHGLDTGAYGNRTIKTPELDKLTAEGVRFTRAFCTTASCAASRSVILTGKYNHTNGTYGHTHGVHHFSCFNDILSLPVILSQAGYRTGRVGKKHFSPEEVFPFQFNREQGEFGRDDVRMSEACRDFIRQSEPFFLYWASHNPHRDNRHLENHPCKPNRFGNPDQPFPGDEESVFDENKLEIPAYLPDIPETRAEFAQYCQSVARLDRGVGRLIKILKEEKVYNHTIIIYLSDNGAAFHGSKTTLYEPGANLPLIIKSPFHKNHGTICDGLITWADITPTIADFCCAACSQTEFYGKSFKSIIDDEHPQNWRNEVFLAHTFHEITNYYPMRVLRGEKHKFIWNIAHPLTYSSASDLYYSPNWQALCKNPEARYGQRSVDAYLHRPRFELYDLENDPQEIKNLAALPQYQKQINDYSDKIRKFQEDTKDPWLHKWEYE